MTSRCQQGGDGDGDLVRLLPDDVFAGVLRRLEPRWLAASRCVCKVWHAIVDGRRLLRADLLPLSLDGIIIHFHTHVYSEFFSRPSTPTRPSISGKFRHLLTTDAWSKATDHCNGLLLLENENSDEYVANPANGWAAPLPPCPSPCSATEGDYYNKYLVFDPTRSEHYQVFSIPRLRSQSKPRALEKSEWPPSPFIIRVYSSMSERWEEMCFSREGEPASTITDIPDKWTQPSVAYWRESLYVHSETNSVMRISMAGSKFELIELPVGAISGETYHSQLHLGRSENGVYFASLCHLWLRVWILDESCGHMKWMVKHANSLKPLLPDVPDDPPFHAPWILQDINYSSSVLNHRVDDNDRPKFKRKFPPTHQKVQWNSDCEDATDDEDMIETAWPGYIDILGFHPYKEIVFLGQSMVIGLAYYLNTSRVQVLGNLRPSYYHGYAKFPWEQEITVSFPYTPCLIGMCPTNK